MSLKPTLENKDGLDEGIANLYIEREGGGFVLDVDNSGPMKLENIEGLLKTRDDRVAKIEKLRGQVTSFGDHTPESIAEMQTKLQASGSNEDFQKQLEGMKTDYGTQLTGKDSTIAELTATIATQSHRNAINGVYSAHATLFKEGTDGAVKNIISKYVGSDKDGNPFIKDLASGAARASNIAGQYESQMTHGEFFEGIKSAITSQGSFPGVDAGDIQVLGYLMSSGASGGSGAGTPNSSTGMTQDKWSAMGLQERTDFYKTNPEEAKRFK